MRGAVMPDWNKKIDQAWRTMTANLDKPAPEKRPRTGPPRSPTVWRPADARPTLRPPGNGEVVMNDRQPTSANLPGPGNLTGQADMIEVKSIKLTIVIMPEAVAALPVRDGVARMRFRVRCDGEELRVDIAMKALRKVQAMIKEKGVDGVVVMVSGRLGAGGAILDAGLSAVVKAPQVPKIG
jgi:hypothetical protein